MVLGDRLRTAPVAETAFFGQKNGALIDMVNWWIVWIIQINGMLVFPNRKVENK